MTNIFIILPNQLFYDINFLKICNIIYLIEEPIFFTKYKFHKMKIILHRASMKCYYDYLINNHIKVKYIEYDKINYDKIFNNNIIHIYDPIDNNILTKFNKLAKKYNIYLNIYDNLLFIETNKDLDEYYNSLKSHSRYLHDHFYRWNRFRLNILIKDNKPLYDKLSFDKENRKPFDKNYIQPKEPKINNNKYVIEAIKYVELNFSNNFGNIENFIYPISFKEAKLLFKDFLKNKLITFGKYQDAIDSNINFGSHSLLSSSINIGILDIRYIINKTLELFNKQTEINKKKIIPSVEAFIRQIIGWRSYNRFIYKYHGETMYEENNLKHYNKLTNHWYTAKTNIIPIDNLIIKVNKYAYLHHIERLMLIGNFALLCLINPKEIYKWFMICFIDSYEWVMIPNVMGMSQYSTKKIIMMTRPYFSSANYILNMSNYKANTDKLIILNKSYYWNEIWNALYYNFINKHYKLLSKIYATSRNVYHWNNKSINEKKNIIKLANKYLDYLDN
jgi:deoxyribodipyrimidine photolyase-related protein